jgi:hypothetical protein
MRFCNPAIILLASVVTMEQDSSVLFGPFRLSHKSENASGKPSRMQWELLSLHRFPLIEPAKRNQAVVSRHFIKSLPDEDFQEP